jgi:membrane fusion protein, copper/silver efflux system
MKKKLLVIALLSLIAAPLVGYSAENTSANNQQAVKTDEKPLYWVDPMEPDVHYKAPGKSRMGMELVPIYSKKKNN